VVKLLTNSLVLRAALVLFGTGAAFLFAIWMMRALRRRIAAEADLDIGGAPTLETLPLHLYNTVIQQLKQQKHELQVQTLAEQRRARTTENFSHAVLSNLSSGVLVFGVNGLVKQANPAAKEILGFHSPAGMSAQDIFRGAEVCSAASAELADEFPTSRAKNALETREPDLSHAPLSEEVDAVLREGSKCRQVDADYATPTGEKRRIAITISPVPAVDGSLLGVACLIADRSEFEQIRHRQELQDEISAEMALELRTSLTMISGYAQRLAVNRDPHEAPQLAADIAGETARLDRHIGGFLAARHAASAGASSSKGLTMKCTTNLGLAFALTISTLALGSSAKAQAAAQTPAPAQTSTPAQAQDPSSLGDYARKAHKDTGKPKPKVFDNDNLPKDDAISIVGAAPDTDTSKTATVADNKDANKDAAAKPSGDDEKAKKEALWKEWQGKLSAQKDAIDLAGRELDVTQREYQLRSAAMYADVGNRLRNSAEWDKEDAQYKQQIADKQKAVEDAKQKLEDLQEAARKAGVPSSMIE
jgi:PAS domain-containing protein